MMIPANDLPYSLEREGEGRYRIRVTAGYIGNVTGLSGHWIAEIPNQPQTPPCKTRKQAVEAAMRSWWGTTGHSARM